MLMIRQPAFFMCGTNVLNHQERPAHVDGHDAVPVLTSMPVTFCDGRLANTAALLTSTSILPNFLMALSTSALHGGFITDVGN